MTQDAASTEVENSFVPAQSVNSDKARRLKLERVGACCVCATNRWSEPIATGEDFEYGSSPDTFVAQQCSQCGLVYLDPRPALSELGRIYGPEYHAYEFTPEKFGLAYRVRSWLENRRLRRWCRHLEPGARVIDVGAGDGFHLKLLREDGDDSWTLEGIDPDEKAVAAARASGLTMHQGVIQEIDLPADSYDFALLIMTIEHVDAPNRLLHEISRILKPGGRIGIVTDNTGSPDFRMARNRHWGGYHFPRHWNLFNKNSMKCLAQNAGLELVSLRTMMSPVNWTYTVHNVLKDWNAPPFLTRQFGLDKPLPLAFFTVFDSILTLFNKGALLNVVLRKPVSPS